MVVDFGRIKKLLEVRVHDHFDHKFIVQRSDEVLVQFFAQAAADGDEFAVVAVPGPPTAENLATWIYHDLVTVISDLAAGVELDLVELWETPTSKAIYPV
jgi:6-pyruvoyl-tetrahydropterin synthase